MSLGVYVAIAVVLLGAALAWAMFRNSQRKPRDFLKDNSGRTAADYDSRPGGPPRT